MGVDHQKTHYEDRNPPCLLPGLLCQGFSCTPGSAQWSLQPPDRGGWWRGECWGGGLLSECPVYSVVQKFDGYEERFYPSQAWVCTRSGGFRSLFRYISGDNDRDQKIDMTVPVMMTESEKGSEMCFYITKEFQSNP